MERRDALIGLASTLAITSTSPLLAFFPTSQSSRFRWSPDGRVFVHEEQRWVESIDLGSHINVLGIEESGSGAILTAAHAGRRFQLHTSDGHHWRG